MITKARDRALSLGAKIHPLMGPIFKTRPATAELGDACSMCVEDIPRASETIVRSTDGEPVFLCLEHDLLIQQVRQSVKGTIDTYESEVLAEILTNVYRPRWIPERLYSKLTARAKHKANQLSQLRIYSVALRILEQETQIIHDKRILAEFEHETRNDKD